MVEVLDAKGKPISQFSGESAKAYRGSNNLRLKPQWKTQADLTSIKGKNVRLRFTLQNAKLYAFQIR